jgi:tetratricopeptide (TPR) repeat protein
MKIANCKLHVANCKFQHCCVPLLACKQCALIILTLVLTLTASAWAGTGEAARKVSEGIAQFQGGDFKTAAELFKAANEALPDDLRIAFDRGCAYAAAGEYDQAVEQFQKSAAAPDHKLATLAHYNLGSVAVAKARAQAGEKPEEAVGDARRATLESLLQAAKHYRDCLDIDPENTDARYNLETIRLWTKYIQDVWQQRDRQKRREEMNLLQYLEWLENEERALRQTSKDLESVKPSPQQREAVRAAENAQRTLTEEIQPLKDKIAAAASGPAQQPGRNAAGQVSADMQKAVELLSRLADEVNRKMTSAADSLAGGALPEAFKSQTEAVEMIDQIFMAVSPYVNLVKRGIDRQEALIDQEQPALEGSEAAWKQRFIARYGRILSAKARLELERLESMPGAKQGPPKKADEDSKPSTSEEPAPEKEQPVADEQTTAQQQQRDMKEALQMGITSAPKVEKLASEAASLLEEDKPKEALPKQQEALKLLKEMLPKQQQQQQNKQDQEKKDQEQKDQEKKDQDKKDQNKKNQKEQDQNKKDQDKQNQQQQQQKKQQVENKQDQQQKEQEKNQQQQNRQAQQKRDNKPSQAKPVNELKKRDQNKEQAEAVLNRARQRQEQYRQLQEALEGYLYRPDKVEKDW